MAKYDAEAVEANEHAAWEGASALYAEHIALLTANSGQADLIKGFASPKRTDRALDVGCGPGLLAKQLSDLVGHVTGVDFSARMVEQARLSYPHLKFDVANAEALPYDDSSFDLIVLNYCAHHLARPEIAFRELRRVLSHGGRLIIIHPIQVRQAAWGSFANSVAEVLPPETIPGGALLNAEDPTVFKDALLKAGFSTVIAKTKVKPVTMSRIDTLITSGWAITDLGSQSREIQEKIEAKTREKAKRFQQADGTYIFPDEVIVALGTN